ncbi:Homeobox protein 9 [Rhizopus stolonifer]|uniref:Homeobox protein 9 n=1 Tax=Rhizopus stolonifer TaxID=4846 RepID=A0A367KP79_RHIST|nr:Homeobox protein 9 [Rhizopus stolonifer]
METNKKKKKTDDDDDDDDNGEKEEEKEKQCKRRLVQKKRRGNLPKCVTAILKQWLIDHHKHPYPTEEEKRALGLKTDLTLNQISNWFINARRRILPFILSQKK